MKSYKLLYQKLPKGLLDILSNYYKPKELNLILEGFMIKRPITLRVNRLKTHIQQVMKDLWNENIKYERVLWWEEALIIKNKKEKDLEKTKLYQAGEIYLQSLSSMIPPLILNPRSGDKILDLTAAPGSKSTQMAALIDNNGYILANEINPIRAERLKFNIAKQEANIIEVRLGDGKRLGPKFNNYFDAILLDAPCSGVGLFQLDHPQTFRSWSTKIVSYLVKEQKQLLKTAVAALKPGGTLVYSTCTLTPEENEAMMKWLLDNYSGMIFSEKIDFFINNTNIVKCELKNVKAVPGNAITILPTSLYEGFFVAKLKKKNLG